MPTFSQQLAQPVNYKRPADMTMGGMFDFKPGPYIWNNPVDGKIYEGTGITEYGGVYPTWKKEIVDAQEFLATEKGIANESISDSQKIFDSYNRSLYEDARVYMLDYLPRYNRGETVNNITADLKAQGNATIDSETFSALRSTQIQVVGVRVASVMPHYLLNLVETVNVDKLSPIGYMDFASQNKIHKRLGEFEVPYQGTAQATIKSWEIDRYGSKFSIGEEYYLYDYPNLNILNLIQQDIQGKLLVAKNEEVYAKMISSDVTTFTSNGAWDDVSSGISDHDPRLDLFAVREAIKQTGLGRAEYTLSNSNHLSAYELNTHINGTSNPAIDVNPVKNVLDIPTDNGGPFQARGWDRPWYLDDLFSDANGVIVGQRDAIKFGNGPSFTRTYTDDEIGVRGVINKWFFGAYVFDGLLVRRITGAL